MGFCCMREIVAGFNFCCRLISNSPASLTGNTGEPLGVMLKTVANRILFRQNWKQNVSKDS